MAKPKTFQIEAILEGVTPLKDGGVSLRFHTNETTKDNKVLLMEYYQSFGWLLFQQNNFQTGDIPKDTAKRDSGQTPSQRLRAVLFVLWTQLDKPGEFEVFYNQKMETFINRVKENLS